MLKNKDIKALVPTTKTYNKSCGTGNGLIIEVSSIKQGGTKCFVGRTRFRKKQTTVYIGSFGNGYGKLSTVPEANREWEKRLIWASQNGRSPKDYGKKEISETKTCSAFMFSLIHKDVSVLPVPHAIRTCPRSAVFNPSDTFSIASI